MMLEKFECIGIREDRPAGFVLIRMCYERALVARTRVRGVLACESGFGCREKCEAFVVGVIGGPAEKVGEFVRGLDGVEAAWALVAREGLAIRRGRLTTALS